MNHAEHVVRRGSDVGNGTDDVLGTRGGPV